MSTPENLGNIRTNLSQEELKEIIDAIDNGQATQVPGTTSLFERSAGCEFDYNGKRYLINESFEVIDTVCLIPSGQSSVQSLVSLLTAGS